MRPFFFFFTRNYPAPTGEHANAWGVVLYGLFLLHGISLTLLTFGIIPVPLV